MANNGNANDIVHRRFDRLRRVQRSWVVWFVERASRRISPNQRFPGLRKRRLRTAGAATRGVRNYVSRFGESN